MQHIKTSPMSVNVAYTGRRFKTEAYKVYIEVVGILLKRVDVPKGKLAIHLRFGLSNPLADGDNPVKPFIDILQKYYGFNDKMIRLHIVEAIDVAKGEEFIEFDLMKLETGRALFLNDQGE